MIGELTEDKPTLTARQQQIYEFLKDKILNRGYGPTVREIGAEFGIRSPNGVMFGLLILIRYCLVYVMCDGRFSGSVSRQCEEP